ncbi:hypothetical protein N665_0277s0002 [Sinapis alba]|nr:hypothetical protein N665_0277s0002 [Sinapis alba]
MSLASPATQPNDNISTGELSFGPVRNAELSICDDEDLIVYLKSIDKENRRSLLLVEETSKLDELEKLSRVGISSFGMNYKVLHGTDEAIGPKAITLYVENGEAINRRS